MENKHIKTREFSSYSFSKELFAGINAAGYVNCTPVQEKTFEYALEGKDVTVMSQTGTGKTAAFLISIYAQLSGENASDIKKRALILAPTRELAIQIEKEAKLLGKNLGLTIGCFYGGGYTKTYAYKQ